MHDKGKCWADHMLHVWLQSVCWPSADLEKQKGHILAGFVMPVLMVQALCGRHWQLSGHQQADNCWTAILSVVAGAALAAIDKFLGTIRQTQDATPYPATGALHLMCDMAHAVAHAINQAQQGQHQAGKQGSKPRALPEVPKLPGSAPLVKTWFGQMRAKGERLALMQWPCWCVLPGSLLQLTCGKATVSQGFVPQHGGHIAAKAASIASGVGDQPPQQHLPTSQSHTIWVA